MFSGKKVLLVGLGLLGGGEGMVKFLLKNGADLTVTDLRQEDVLRPTLNRLKKFRKLKFVLGRHEKGDFVSADLIVFNPAVPYKSPWVKLAQKLNKEFYNDTGLFLKVIQERKSPPKELWVTGTRGKTTVTTWTHHLLGEGVLGGNIPNKNLLDIIDGQAKKYVLEMSSYQLEYPLKNFHGPEVAILTNCYVDHLNRYKTMANYREIKSLVYGYQEKGDKVIFSYDEKTTGFFLAKKPKGKAFFVSQKSLPKGLSGIFLRDDKIFFTDGKKETFLLKKPLLPAHKLTNLLFAMLGANLFGAGWGKILARLKTLPQVTMRQEMVLKNRRWKVVNDSTGTSPEATMAAILAFADESPYLLTGGTDKDLDFRQLARLIGQKIPPEKIFFLAGTATEKLLSLLEKQKYFQKSPPRVFGSLSEALAGIAKKSGGMLVFSPGAASFGLFKNEFDRGEQFNTLAKKLFKT